MNNNLKIFLLIIVGLILSLILAYVLVRLFIIKNNVLFALIGIPAGLFIGKFSYWLSHKVIIK